MAVFESTHPFGRSMETIYSALNWGMTADKSTLPKHLITNYVDLIDGRGVARLRVINTNTEKRAFYMFPRDAPADNPFWNTDHLGESVQIQHRLIVDDLFARPITRTLPDGREVYTNILQFDVLNDGIVLSYPVAGEEELAFGFFEGLLYDEYESLAREHGSLEEIAKLAAEF